MSNKESQLNEIDRFLKEAIDKPLDLYGLDPQLAKRALMRYYEMRRREQQLQEEVENLVQSLEVADSDLEVAHQANSEISKHNQELSKENERLVQRVTDLETDIMMQDVSL